MEFGLIRTSKGLRAYGGGILSSSSETVYCLESPIPERKPLDVLDALRTPYRIDILQPVYFVINNFDTLYHLTDMDLMGLIRKSRELGEFTFVHRQVAETCRGVGALPLINDRGGRRHVRGLLRRTRVPLIGLFACNLDVFVFRRVLTDFLANFVVSQHIVGSGRSAARNCRRRSSNSSSSRNNYRRRRQHRARVEAIAAFIADHGFQAIFGRQDCRREDHSGCTFGTRDVHRPTILRDNSDFVMSKLRDVR